MIFTTIKQALQLTKKRKADEADAAERAAIAKAFNDRYTYRKEWKKGMPYVTGTSYGCTPRSGYAWMCPECNQIHHPTESSVFDGLHYPRCCSTAQGNRLSCGIKTAA